MRSHSARSQIGTQKQSCQHPRIEWLGSLSIRNRGEGEEAEGPVNHHRRHTSRTPEQEPIRELVQLVPNARSHFCGLCSYPSWCPIISTPRQQAKYINIFHTHALSMTHD